MVCPGLAQEQADVADVAADVFVAGLVQGGDSPVGQAVAVVQDGGDELVGEGDPGAAVVAGQLAGAVAAAAVQGGFAELGGWPGQGGGCRLGSGVTSNSTYR